MAQPKITVVNPWHWLDENGHFPEEPKLRAKMIRVAQCIEYAGPMPRGHGRETLIPCRRRPGGKSCTGFLWVLKQTDDAILAFCERCQTDEFLIYEWEDTVWAKGLMEAVNVEQLARERGVEGPQLPTPDNLDERLRRSLVLLGSPLEVERVRALISTAESPVLAVQAVMDSLISAPQSSAMERFLPVLMEAWNETPRPELGGRRPSERYESRPQARPSGKPGRNDPCPCGSGKKYKKCCLGRAIH